METIDGSIILGNDLSMLFKKHEKSLMSYCVKLTKDLTNAEDLLQEAYIKALITTKGAFRKDRNFVIWMNSIIHNAFIDCLRGKKKVSVESFDVNEKSTRSIARKPSQVLNPEELFIQNERKSLLEDMMKDFHPNLQKVVMLYFFKGYKVREIAIELKICENTIKTMIRSARRKLRPLCLAS
jgi:RNA polymerase sigma factor (sigma-70 family)